ncbi:hypothetical protein OE88DRAFT_1704528 [Heliocybe sulcata]|uniref:DUF6534 domain-containing protein n=1 Tax=Heliocybe sulcata TaxID=5364 RepID=A0A5C3N304_9AGAM|nr:hypothetical protein OE88DRAFT_1704528 [Heliocybe sulcata]
MDSSAKALLVSSYGSLLVGLVASAILFGITNLQVFIYLKSYPNDLVTYKIAVGFLWFLDAFHLALSTHAVFWYLVTNFAILPFDLPVIWSFKLEISIMIITILVVQSLYALRLWKVTALERSRVAVYLVIASVLCNYGIAIAVIYVVYRKISIVIQAQQYAWLVYTSYGTCTAVDVTVVVTFCGTMWGHRSVHLKSKSVIHRIMLYVLASGSLTGLFCVICLVTLATMPGSFVSYGISFSMNKVYVNSYLAVLNSRDSCKQGSVDQKVEGRDIVQRRVPYLIDSVEVGCSVHEQSSDDAGPKSFPVFQAESSLTPQLYDQREFNCTLFWNVLIAQVRRVDGRDENSRS